MSRTFTSSYVLTFLGYSVKWTGFGLYVKWNVFGSRVYPETLFGIFFFVYGKFSGNRLSLTHFISRSDFPFVVTGEFSTRSFWQLYFEKVTDKRLTMWKEIFIQNARYGLHTMNKFRFIFACFRKCHYWLRQSALCFFFLFK